MAPQSADYENLRIVREPKWDRGAYAMAPKPMGPPAQPHFAATVDCWAGTREEFFAIVGAIQAGLLGDEGGQLSGSVTRPDGLTLQVHSATELEDALGELGDVLALRVEIAQTGGSASGLIVATCEIPGLRIVILGEEPSRTLGIAEFAFRRMMAGYVDRMGSWRGLAWVASALGPLLLASIAISPGDANPWARAGVLLTAVVGSAAVFFSAYSLLLVSTGFELLDVEPTGGVARWKGRLQNVKSHAYVRRTVGLIGVLTVGVVGNKLAELLPWP